MLQLNSEEVMPDIFPDLLNVVLLPGTKVGKELTRTEN